MEVQQEFIPGSIHKEDVREFWRTDLQASEWVIDVLGDGYIIPFVGSPPLEELRKQGVIEFTEEKPHCVSPLTVAKKMSSEGILKNRLCLDLSRCVNLCIKDHKVTLSHLQRALELTKEGDYQVKYDFKSAYHHIKIHPLQTKYLGAAFVRPDGGKQYFFFKYLPFGLSSAVHCITKLFKPINAFIPASDIRHSNYLDDGRIVSETEEKAEEDRVIVYNALDQSGWIRECKKSDKRGEASQAKGYLGFIIDTSSMTVRLDEAKRQRILQNLWKTTSNGSVPIPATELAKTLGRVVATEPALGTVVIMALRAAYADLEVATKRKGWKTSLVMSRESIAGLKFFAENCPEFDNSPIRSTATEMSALSIVGPPSTFMKTSFVANHVRTENDKIWASDASGYATCAYSIQGEHLYFRGMLNEEEQTYSSGHRELLAVTKTLEFYHQSAAILD
jgi:hypothetical protein